MGGMTLHCIALHSKLGWGMGMSSAFICCCLSRHPEKAAPCYFAGDLILPYGFALYHSARGIRASGTAMGTGLGEDGHSKELAG